MTTAQVNTENFKAGLDGIIAGESKICLIDGERGKLFYRGYNVDDLAKNSSFEETAYLLLKGSLPQSSELESFKAELLKARKVPSQILEIISLIPPKTHPMDMLRTLVSAMGQYEEDANSTTSEGNFKKATHLIAQLPTIIAAYHRIRNNEKPIEPSSDLNLASNFLYMLSGNKPDEYAQRIFDMCLILHADHCFNASTFTARVTAATLSDLHSAITAAIGALKGPLHGGANQEVMDLLLKIGSLDNVIPFLTKMFEENKKVPGFGHRVYRSCEDPRATILREASRELAQKENNTKWFEMSQAIEKFVVETSKSKGKPIYPNVDFYSASTYHVLGIDPQLFTPIFAMSRVTGWASHVIEQHSNNRLIRPQAHYVGNKDLAYVQVDKR